MSDVRHVAEYILRELGEISALKLQKLVYYCQAWSLVWDDEPIFDARIEAWANGPVVPELFNIHRGQFRVAPGSFAQGDLNLPENHIDTIDVVLEFYGDKSSQWLSDLTHQEDPWNIAREGVPDSERSNQEISLASLAEYYSSL